MPNLYFRLISFFLFIFFSLNLIAGYIKPNLGTVLFDSLASKKQKIIYGLSFGSIEDNYSIKFDLNSAVTTYKNQETEKINEYSFNLFYKYNIWKDLSLKTLLHYREHDLPLFDQTYSFSLGADYAYKDKIVGGVDIYQLTLNSFLPSKLSVQQYMPFVTYTWRPKEDHILVTKLMAYFIRSSDFSSIDGLRSDGYTPIELNILYGLSRFDFVVGLFLGPGMFFVRGDRHQFYTETDKYTNIQELMIRYYMKHGNKFYLRMERESLRESFGMSDKMINYRLGIGFYLTI